MEMKERMKSLGFTEYESKAYIALLRDNPATGYAVAKHSGVPRSKIYEVLDGLTARGDVIVSDGNPPLYRPLSVREMIARRKAEAEANFESAGQALLRLEAPSEGMDNIWNLKGRDAILQKVNDCIAGASERVLLEIWREDFPHIELALRDAAARGVKIQIIAYGGIEADYAEVYLHDMSEAITDEYGGRWIVFSADDSQVIAGTVSLDERNQAAWTMHPGLVMPITEVIIHDLYIAEIMKAHRDVLEASFGRDLRRLREKFQMKMDFLSAYLG